MNDYPDLGKLEAAYREGDYTKVCNECGLFLDRLFNDLLAELRVKPVVRVDQPGATLGNLIRQFSVDRLLTLLPDERASGAEFVNWNLLDAVLRARNRAAHSGKSGPPTRGDAGNCLDVTRSLHRWFAPRIPQESDQGFLAATTVDGLGACVEPLQTALAHASRSGRVSVKVLGLTLAQAWKLWWRDLLKEVKCPCEVSFTMLDPEWDQVQGFDPRWKVQAKSVVESIALEAPTAISDHPNLSLRFWKYRLRPVIHGALINDDFLAASLLPTREDRTQDNPEDVRGSDQLLAADHPYILARAGAGALSNYLVAQYQQAFRATTTGPCWWPEKKPR